MEEYLESLQKKLASVPEDSFIYKHNDSPKDHSCFSENLSVRSKGKGLIETYLLYPGIELSFCFIRADKIIFEHRKNANSIEVNYCRFGRSVRKLKDKSTVFLAPGDVSFNLTDVCADSELNLPLGFFEGITINIELDKMDGNYPEILAGSGITGESLKQKFCPDKKASVIHGSERIEQIFDLLWELPENLCVPYFKCKLVEFLLFLARDECQVEIELTEYRSDQNEIIKEIHDYLLANLDKRITIEMLSKRFLINTTAIKNLFKSVYGSSLAAHIKKHRMEKAAYLLKETNDTVSAIARSVGYESQSKFTDAFKEAYKMTPNEYRK